MSGIVPHPLTLASIGQQNGRCSCGRSSKTDESRWHLCQYHAGFDDALEVARVPEVPS